MSTSCLSLGQSRFPAPGIPTPRNRVKPPCALYFRLLRIIHRASSPSSRSGTSLPFVTFAAEWAVFCKQASASQANTESTSVGCTEDMAEQQVVDQATVDQILHDRVSGFGEW